MINMTDNLNPRNNPSEPLDPSSTGSTPRILVNGKPDHSGTLPPLAPTELSAEPGAVKSSMPDWAQQAVTGNVRKNTQKQTGSAYTPEQPSYDAPHTHQQVYPERAPYGASSQPGNHASQPTRRRGVTVSPGVIIAICAVIIVLVVALVVVTLSALNNVSSSSSTNVTAEEEVDHRWDGLSWKDGRAYFEENGKIVSQTGVDVSDHQGWIDWNAVSGDDIDFAYIRLGNRGYTEGAIFEDQYYEYNIDSAHDAGLDVGVYFFSQAINEEEAREEAEFVLEKLNGRTLELPIAWDHEVVEDPSGRANNIDRETLTKCAQAFFDVIEAAGYKTILYGNTHDLARIDLEALNAEPLWLAEYGVDKPTPKLDLALWQYTNGATVAGIDGAVDLDIRFTNIL